MTYGAIKCTLGAEVKKVGNTLRLVVKKLKDRVWDVALYDRDDPHPLTHIRVTSLGDAAELGFILRALGHNAEVVRELEVGDDQ